MKNLTKQEWQKRGLLVQKLCTLIELTPNDYVAFTLSCLLHPAGLPTHPARYSDNELLGHIEREIYKIENPEEYEG